MDCVLRSFAHAIGEFPKKLIDMLGHDGTEIVDPSMAEPYCRRGFGTPELIQVLFELGYTVTPITKHRPRICFGKMMVFDKDKDHVNKYLGLSKYTLAGGTHMIGVRDGNVLDLTGQCTRPEEFDYDVMYIIEQSYG